MSEPILPPELERHIFEIAAHQSVQTAAKLVLVSRRVQQWVEPIMYSVLVFSHTRKSYPPFNSPVGGKSTTLDEARLKRLGKHVRHLVVQQRSQKTIKKVLDYCPNVENLALWLVDGSTAPLVPVLESLTLRELSMDAIDFLYLNYNPSDHDSRPDVTLNITHFDLINFDQSFDSDWVQLIAQWFPKLTHLAVTGTPLTGFMEEVLRECLKLELFVVIYTPIEDSGLDVRDLDVKIKDRRLVVTHSKEQKAHTVYWDQGPDLGIDFWKMFEERRDALKSNEAACE